MMQTSEARSFADRSTFTSQNSERMRSLTVRSLKTSHVLQECNSKDERFSVEHLRSRCSLRRATFFGGVNFERTLFNRRSHFEGTRFHGEVLLTQTHIAVLKKFVSSHVNMDGAVLHTADFWDNERLSHYSFRDAFLISVNLAGKELENCDFTGAVFKSVLTQGWKPDARTRRNTK